MAIEETDKKIRIALLASRQTIVENSSVLGHMLTGFTDQGHHAALVCPPDEGTNLVVVGSAEIITYPVFEVPLFANFNKKILIEKLFKFKPDILHCLCESLLSITKYLSNELNVPCLIMLDSLHRPLRGPYFILDKCADIVTPAESIRASMIKSYPYLKDKIELINIGSFVDKTAGCFNAASQPATLVVSHPFHKIEEFENLFGAIRQLVINGYEIMVVVIGGGRAESELWQMLEAFDLLKIVTIVPREIPRRSVLVAGDIFIRPWPVDVFDTMLLEAMSLGCAVAACKEGVDDLIVENETAVIFNPTDELSIAGALQKLLDSRDFARKLAANAQDYVRKNHSVSTMISETMRIYHKILNLPVQSNSK